MKIAQIAPLTDSVPPKLSISAHQLIHHLTETLVEWGHEVMLFATRDSRTIAHLEAVWPQGLVSSPIDLVEAPQTLLLERAFFSGHRFDIIHSHLDTLAFPCARRSLSPVVTTVHSRPDLPGSAQAYREFQELPLVALLKRQRRSLPWANWVATVHPGLPASRTFHPAAGTYLAFWDRIGVGTGILRAIQLARKVGLPLKIAGEVDPSYEEYFDFGIRSLLHEPGIEYIGPISGARVNEFFGGALAFILPGQGGLPGHLAVIEALAAGTPVIIASSNLHAELIDGATTGFVCHTADDMVAAVENVSMLDRRHCRDAFEAQFTVDRMANEYLTVYETVIANSWTTIASGP